MRDGVLGGRIGGHDGERGDGGGQTALAGVLERHGDVKRGGGGGGGGGGTRGKRISKQGGGGGSIMRGGRQTCGG